MQEVNSEEDVGPKVRWVILDGGCENQGSVENQEPSKNQESVTYHPHMMRYFDFSMSSYFFLPSYFFPVVLNGDVIYDPEEYYVKIGQLNSYEAGSSFVFSNEKIKDTCKRKTKEPKRERERPRKNSFEEKVIYKDCNCKGNCNNYNHKFGFSCENKVRLTKSERHLVCKTCRTQYKKKKFRKSFIW